MFKDARAVLLLCGMAGCGAVAATILPAAAGGEDEGQQVRWACHTANQALARKQQVTQGLLPRVAFTGQTQPATVEARMAQHKVPALSVAVIRDGQLDWSAAWGRLQADGDAAGCDSLFQAGSLAKPATVLAALRMQEQGLVDLDADIASYLASWTLPAGAQTQANPVTLRNLFTHTAGITPGGYEGYAQGQRLPTDPQTVAGQAPSNARKVEVLQAPGTSLRYSGGGYTVAEIALQDHLHAPFEQLMRDWLTAPVGMKQADFTQPLPAASHAYTARGHVRDGSLVAGGWHQHPEQAAAGLWATASDLAALLIELRKGWQGDSKVFSQAQVHELLANPIDSHAYGFRLMGEGDQVFLTHYGGTVGYRAGMSLNLQSGNGAVYLSNSDNGSDLGAEFLAAVAKVYGWPVFQQTWVEQTTQPVEVLKSLVGRYQFEDGPAVAVVHEEEALTLVFPNGDRYALTPIGGGPRQFIHPGTAVRAGFEGDGVDTTLQLYGDTGRRVAEGK